MRKVWTKSEDKFLKQYYHRGASLCANILNRSLSSIYGRADLLGLSGIFIEKFSDEESLFVKENYSVMSNKEIGKSIGRSHWSIKAKAKYLGLQRTNDQAKAIQNRCSTNAKRKNSS